MTTTTDAKPTITRDDRRELRAVIRLHCRTEVRHRETAIALMTMLFVAHEDAEDHPEQEVRRAQRAWDRTRPGPETDSK